METDVGSAKEREDREEIEREREGKDRERERGERDGNRWTESEVGWLVGWFLNVLVNN